MKLWSMTDFHVALGWAVSLPLFTEDIRERCDSDLSLSQDKPVVYPRIARCFYLQETCECRSEVFDTNFVFAFWNDGCCKSILTLNNNFHSLHNHTHHLLAIPFHQISVSSIFVALFPLLLTFSFPFGRDIWMRLSVTKSATCRSWRSTKRQRLTNISPERSRRSRRAKDTGEVRCGQKSSWTAILNQSLKREKQENDLSFQLNWFWISFLLYFSICV